MAHRVFSHRAGKRINVVPTNVNNRKSPVNDESGAITVFVRDWGGFAIAVGGAIIGWVSALFTHSFTAGAKLAELSSEIRLNTIKIKAMEEWREEFLALYHDRHTKLQLDIRSLPTREEQGKQFDRLAKQVDDVRRELNQRR